MRIGQVGELAKKLQQTGAMNARCVRGLPYPTTLPTLDELIGDNGLTADNVHQHLLALTGQTTRAQVYTLHAELEVMKLRGV